MEVLKRQINVLREIVHYHLPAHIAFLSHKPYRTLYYTYHSQMQLADDVIGWKIYKNKKYMTYILFNSETKRHPICPNLVYNHVHDWIMADHGCHCFQFSLNSDERIIHAFKTTDCTHVLLDVFDEEACEDMREVYNHILEHKRVPYNFVGLTYNIFYNNVNPLLTKAIPKNE